MTRTIGAMRKVGVAAAVGGLVLGAASLQAEEFSATATIQNTVDVENLQDMDFGILFASGANNKAVAGLTLSAVGGITAVGPIAVGSSGDVALAPQFLSLGEGAPARGRIASGLDVTISVPEHKTADLVDASAATDAWSPGNAVPLSVNTDNAEPKFFLVDFVVDDVVGGTVSAGGGAGKFDIDAAFGVEAIEFGIGATIFTDGGAGDGTIAENYQAAVYTGTFEVEASY